MRVAVIGYGVEGRAAVAYWAGLGHDVTVCAPSLDTGLPDGVGFRAGADYLQGLESFDLVMRSPGVHPGLLPPGARVTSVTEEFLTQCPATVIGVTGTQGKGSTVKAIESILTCAGRKTFVGGNIGIPPLDFLNTVDADDVVVLELSNMQLIDAGVSPQIAVVLAVTPDHANWHADLEEYYAAKTAIAAHQQPGDVIVYDAVNPVAAKIAAASPARRVPLGADDGFHIRAGSIRRGPTVIAEPGDIPLRGRHSLYNLTAAAAAVWELVDADVDVVRAGIRAVRPLPHRQQPVATVNGVLWVNDSLSTTPQTARAAVEAFDEPKILILGGSSKGVSFEPLARSIAVTNVRAVLLTGQDAPRIATALHAAGLHGYELLDAPMTRLVDRAAALAQPGDVVLLSPACASFDAYRNYVDRGDQFAAAVHALAVDAS